MVHMSTNTVKLNDDEEKIEEGFDTKIIKEYEENLENGGIETFTHDEVKKILGI